MSKMILYKALILAPHLNGLSVSAIACSNSDLVSFRRPFSLKIDTKVY